MDKYTVDLDKVLNDFEYSEYSLESAKLNKSVHEDLPNTSINSNFSNKNNTTVKHSINNVFHSLNEYLSSDITPRKVENELKSQKNVNFIKDIQSSSFSETGQNIPDIARINSQENTQETLKYESPITSEFPNFYADHKENDFHSLIDNLVEKTDVFSDTFDAVSEATEIVKEKSTEIQLGGNDIDANVIDSNEDNTELDRSQVDHISVQIKSEFEDKDSLYIKEEVSEEILIDLGNISNFFDGNKEVDIKSVTGDDKTSQENLYLAVLPCNNAEIRNDGNISSTAMQNCETHIPKIVTQIYDKDNLTIEKEVKPDENKTVNSGEEQEVVTVKFQNDYDLDEDNLDQYFQELEQELGMDLEKICNSDQEIIANGKELSTSENNALQILETISKEPEIEYSLIEEKYSDSQIEEKRLPLETEEKKIAADEISESKTEGNEILLPHEPDQSNSQIEENVKIISENQTSISLEEGNSLLNNDKVVDVPMHNNQESRHSEETKANDSFTSDSNIEKPDIAHTHGASENAKENLEKNFRPQQLLLTKENQDVSRKINLIGDPGSTPYNNVYSTTDFEKNNLKQEGSGESTSERPVSPTYSDVSTDSVSSSTSNDVYDDAVSEIRGDHRKKVEKEDSQNTNRDCLNGEAVQNNLVSSKEMCKNDVTTGKDFKNNLKSNNTEEAGEFSKSNIPAGDRGGPSEVTTENSCENGVRMMENENEEFANSNLNTSGASSEQHVLEESASSLGIDWLGKQAPLWIPDNEATNCLHCDMKFTVIKRRHHCRACGLVLCAKCCNLKYRLDYLDAEARVCKKCYDILNKDTNSSSGSEVSQECPSPSRNLVAVHEASNLGQPNPNNPLEYCSTIPPMQQIDPGAIATPSVMVPVGVLKRKGSNKGRSNKSVMFCDGIRPGSDLTNLDTDFNYSDSQKAQKSKKSYEKCGKSGKNLDLIDPETRSFIPNDEKSLPPTVTIFKSDIKYSSCANNSGIVEMLRNESLIFALQSNLFVHVKISNLDCCVNRMVWCFSTEGLINVGQDEIVVLLELMENESTVPKDIFLHLNNIYLEAVNGSSVKELGLSLHTSSPFLCSKNHAGFVYIRPTFQCLQNIILPKEPYLIGVLIHRWETPWAKLFPLRLVLRLGAEYKYYPSPIISTRERDSVFVEIGHTIINLLADFRNFSYTLPQIRGLTIHMQDKNTTVTIPVNRYDQVLKGLCNSSDHILAFAGNFSTSADSHLVCIQDTQSATNNYSTHAINICNQPRKVTGASFIVFNGALKSTSGLTAKSNIVEDGLMIQILPEHMLQVRESLRNMKDHVIKCGCVNEESDETVTVVWGEPDTSFNVGVLSPIDNKAMTGIPSIRVHNGKDYTCNSGCRLIRWTEVFIIQSGDDSSRNQDPVDISKISENVAKATCQALVKYLDLLISNSFYKIGLRANLHVENVSYSAGSNNVKLPPIYMKSLDNELIPVLHRITSNNSTEQPIILELIFRILNI